MFLDSFTKVTGQKKVLDVGSFYNRFFLLPLVFDLQWQSKFSFFFKKKSRILVRYTTTKSNYLGG